MEDRTERLIAAIDRLAAAVEEMTRQSSPRSLPFTKTVHNTFAVRETTRPSLPHSSA